MPIALAALLSAAIAAADPAIAAHPSRSAPAIAAPKPDRISPNDNRRAAGSLRNGVLTLRLEVRWGEWRPHGDSGVVFRVAGFAEEGKTLQDPGPMIRVPVGTEVHATVTNRLDKPMWLYGLGAKRGWHGDSTLVPAGASRDVGFRADEAGTFYYAGRTDTLAVDNRFFEDSELSGVIIVDPAGVRPIADRIFVVSVHSDIDLTGKRKSGIGPNPMLSFNGLAWPHTERLNEVQDDSVHWRFVNVSAIDHPLHLHGFFFHVDAKGDGVRDTTYAPGAGRMGVTEYLVPGQTTRLSWSPDRPGNWIFHCHFAGHIAAEEAYESDRADMSRHTMLHNHMGGLVLGIHVAPRGRVLLAGAVTRNYRLIVRSRAKQYGDFVGYAFVLGGTAADSDSTAMPTPGPLLELTRGERVAFTIVNQSHDEAAVHWHGIELESFADGVPNWSGWEKNVLPMISPGDSFTVRYTPPRAGTFMYHSHSNEFQQISSGLYGALLVLEPGQKRDTTLDKVLLISDDGPVINVVNPTKFPAARLNGRRDPLPIELLADTTTRLRLINIRGEFPMQISITDGTTPIEWRIAAKDGMAIPAARIETRPATMVIAAGETYDVLVRPRAGQKLVLRYALPGAPPPIAQAVAVPVEVR